MMAPPTPDQLKNYEATRPDQSFWWPKNCLLCKVHSLNALCQFIITHDYRDDRESSFYSLWACHRKNSAKKMSMLF